MIADERTKETDTPEREIVETYSRVPTDDARERSSSSDGTRLPRGGTSPPTYASSGRASPPGTYGRATTLSSEGTYIGSANARSEGTYAPSGRASTEGTYGSFRRSSPSKFRGKHPIQWHKRQIKYKCHTYDGKKLAAGGIFFYGTTDAGKGLWLVQEEEMGTDVYTDFGGKYDHNDGDINATIGREFREETYNTAEIPYAEIRAVPESRRIYIDGYDCNPVYVCIVAHIDDFKVRFDREQLIRQRECILKANPLIPQKWYKTLDVRFVPLKDISSYRAKVSNRLQAILTALCDNLRTYHPDIRKFFEDFEIRKRME